MPVPGELVSIDGRDLHVIRKGAGEPTVVFDAGAGLFGLTWRKVQERVAEFTATIAWDRPGFGWSDPPRRPLDLDSVTDDLAAVLEQTGAPPPYILVSHSLAGFYARRFAQRFPRQVAGMVLVDVSHERQYDVLNRLQRALQNASMVVMPHAAGLARRFGRGRFLKVVRTEFPELSPAEAEALVDVWLRPDAIRVMFPEVGAAFKQAATLGLEPDALEGMPLVVLAAGQLPGGEAFRKHRMDVQLPQLAALSRNSTLRVLPDVGHGIPLEAPEAVVDAVREVIEGFRQSPRGSASAR